MKNEIIEKVSNIKKRAESHLSFCENSFFVDGEDRNQLQLIKNALDGKTIKERYHYNCKIIPRYVSKNESIKYRMNIRLEENLK